MIKYDSLKPLHQLVHVKLIMEEKSHGFIIPKFYDSTGNYEEPVMADVLAVSDDLWDICVGDKVYVGKNSTYKGFDFDDGTLLIDAAFILGLVDE